MPADLPCIGAGITVVDPGFNTETAAFERGRGGFMKSRAPKRAKYRDSRGRLLRAYVTAHEDDGKRSARIYWRCGKMSNVVYAADEGTTWAHGHGDQARAALLASRAMAAR